MTSTLSLDTHAMQLAEILHTECAARGIKFSQVRNVLALKWFSNEKDTLTPEVRAALDRVYACRQQADEAGYGAACLDWLRTAHGVAPGDTVRLDSDGKILVLVIEGLGITVNSTDLPLSMVALKAKCLSDGGERAQVQDYYRFANEPMEKVENKEPQ